MIEKFLHYLEKEKRYSEHTLIAYRNDLQSCEAFLQSTYSIELAAAQKNHLRSWIAQMTEDGLLASSIHRKMTATSTFFRYLMREGLVLINPARGITLPKKPKRLASYVEEKAIERFDTDFVHSKDYSNLRDEMIFEILYQTGIRLSELVSLTETDIDTKRNMIKVFGKRKKERYIPIGDDLVSKIHEFTEAKKIFFETKPVDNEFILLDSGKKLYPKFVYRVINSYLSSLTKLEKKSPHVMRHTFATHLLEEGAELNSIKELLGHASLSSTQIYTHSSLAKIRKIYKNSHPKS